MQAANDKGADQTARKRRLICALFFAYGKSRFCQDVAHLAYEINNALYSQFSHQNIRILPLPK